ncbi:MAG: Flp pilus assembly complex ATPase component TadA [Actinobacteria bacterium]|nr:Flp pilus assembly complex ATPase component TadA [Actinomycetota bacterium]MBU1493150.1 Flp pilus assembly complex ATPase component TadA [Actinomycetota bacterium]
MLLEEGLVTRPDLERAKARQLETGETLSRVLVDEEIVPEVDLVKVLARHVGVEFVNLAEIAVDPSAAVLVPEMIARRHSIIPIGFDNGRLVVAMADPGNVLVIDDIRAITGLPIKVKVATRSSIDEAIRRVNRMEDAVTDFGALIGEDDIDDDLAKIEAAIEEAPIVKLVNTLVSRAVSERASDIHIEPAEKDLRVRFRIDGVLHEIMTTPKSVTGAVVSRLKIMADLDIAERRVPQDGRVALKVGGRQIDLRVATLPTIYGEKVVMRILDKDDAILPLEDLGFLPESLARFKESYTKPYGAILVTGPTGSGKTTTLYSTLNIINRPDRNIITVEDPVEYRLPGIIQVQVNRKAGLLFATALKSILRSDPDVVLIGEVRDTETARIAVEAALTGHLVLTTLHTNDASSSIGRLVDMGVESYLVSSALDSIVAQRLARKICSRCRQPREATPQMTQQMGFDPDEGPITVYDAVGCKVCSDTGYRGRLCINEILLVSEEIQRMAVERRPSDEIARVAVEQGMITLRRDGMEKVRLGMTTLEEVLRVVV